MIIDITYQGALAAQNKRIPLEERADPLAGKEVQVTRDGEAFTLKFSDQMIEFKDSTADFFAKDVNVQNADPSDIFSYRPQDQWLVFSQYLHETSFFDSLSREEMLQAESALQHITDGLDSLTHTGINFFGGIKTELDSHEAQLELASSSAALSYFSEKFLSGDVKEGFDQLTKQYIIHNTKKVNGYQSIEERFYAARAKITPVQAELSAEQSRHLSMTNKLGKAVYSEKEFESLIQTYTELFTNIHDESDLNAVLADAKRILLEFATKGIQPTDRDYSYAQEFVGKRTEDTFQRIGEYWNKLLTK